MEESKSELSEQDQRALNYLALAANVLRPPPVDSGTSSKSPWWNAFLQPGVLAALVTVVVGGIMGNFIAATIQAGAKEREFQQSWMKARGDQALLAYKEYTDQEQETVKRAYELIGGCIAAADDLIGLTDPSFSPGSHEGIETQRKAIRKTYNDYGAQWSKDGLKLKLLMSYYHPQHEITDAWKDVEVSVTEYMDCSSDWYVSHEDESLDPKVIETACKDKKDTFNEKVAQFTERLEKGRRYVWEGWESPDQLRNSLESRYSPTPTPTPLPASATK
jgi:hypothetical protein